MVVFVGVVVEEMVEGVAVEGREEVRGRWIGAVVEEGRPPEEGEEVQEEEEEGKREVAFLEVGQTRRDCS